MKNIYILSIITLLISTSVYGGNIYKCVDPEGNKTFTSTPCKYDAGGTETRLTQSNGATLRSAQLSAGDIDPKMPSKLISNFKTACDTGNNSLLFSLHTKKLETQLASAPNKKMIVRTYCEGIERLIRRIGNDPKKAKYSLRKERTNQKNHTLCISTYNKPDDCKFGFDVAMENGKLKKDEF